MNGMTPFYRNCIAVVSRIFRVLFRYRVVTHGSVPVGGAVCCANHTSWIDPLFVAFSQRRQVHFMGKVELFRHKLLGKLIRKLGAFPVTRGTGGAEALAHAETLLRDGRLVGLFPEGTRSKTGVLLPGKTGAVRLAHDCGVPIIPMAIVCGGAPRVRLFRRTYVVVGEPIPPEALGIETGSGLEIRNATRMLMSRIAALQQEGRTLCAQPHKKESKTAI